MFAETRSCLPKLSGKVRPVSDDDVLYLRGLADAVYDRRTQLNLSQLDVAARGGPSDTTLTKIEAAELDRPRPSTLRKLDKGLDWQEGSARALLYEGTPPVPIDTPTWDPSAVWLPPLSEDTTQRLLNVAAETETSFPDDLVSDLERAVSLLITAHALLNLGQMGKAGDHIMFADRLYSWAVVRLPTLDFEDRPLTEPAYSTAMRTERALLQFGVLRGLIDPAFEPDVSALQKPVFSFRSALRGKRQSATRLRVRVLSQAVLAHLRNAEDAGEAMTHEDVLQLLRQLEEVFADPNMTIAQRIAATEELQAVLPFEVTKQIKQPPF